MGEERGEGRGGLGKLDVVDAKTMEVMKDHIPTLPFLVPLAELQQRYSELAHHPAVAAEQAAADGRGCVRGNSTAAALVEVVQEHGECVGHPDLGVARDGFPNGEHQAIAVQDGGIHVHQDGGHSSKLAQFPIELQENTTEQGFI